MRRILTNYYQSMEEPSKSPRENSRTVIGQRTSARDALPVLPYTVYYVLAFNIANVQYNAMQYYNYVLCKSRSVTNNKLMMIRLFVSLHDSLWNHLQVESE